MEIEHTGGKIQQRRDKVFLTGRYEGCSNRTTQERYTATPILNFLTGEGIIIIYAGATDWDVGCIIQKEKETKNRDQNGYWPQT